MKSLRQITIFIFLISQIGFSQGEPPPPPPEAIFGEIFFETFLERELTEDEKRSLHRGPGRFRGPRIQEVKLLSEFDLDHDGILNDDERRSARKRIQELRSEPAPTRQNYASQKIEIEKPNPEYLTKDLYDQTILRTFYLNFPNDDWYEELGDFYKTDVEVTADLIVDGKNYRSIGVHFRGNSSYFGTLDSEKKSINLSINHADKDQRLYGYRTINLLNCHSDASFMREVLYSQICRDYIPAPKANFVKLVINGENWGIYANVQQFNKDLIGDNFDSKKGDRWKVPANPRERGGALVWIGDEIDRYKSTFELKTNDEKAWKDLIQLCKILDQTSDDQLIEKLEKILAIDEILWYLALENVFIDNDGYISRGCDYNLFQAKDDRFYLLPHDNNETFRFAESSGGRGPNSWSDIEGNQLDPLAQIDDKTRPLINRLLSIPELQKSYLAKVRTIVDQWLSVEKLGPIIENYRELISAEVEKDQKKLYSYSAFVGSFSEGEIETESDRGGFDRGPRRSVSLIRFISERRNYLLDHPLLNAKN